MTLDEAIKRCEEVVEEQEKKAKEWHENQVRKCELIRFAEMDYTHENECKECASDHRHLAEWLKELKRQREAWEKVKEEIRNSNIADFIATQTALEIIDKHLQEVTTDADCD